MLFDVMFKNPLANPRSEYIFFLQDSDSFNF